MEPRSHKLRRIERFRRSLPHVSASALTAIMSNPDRCRDQVSRRTIREARNLTVDQVTPYGPLLHPLYLDAADGGRPIQVLIACPFALLSVAYKECEPFRQLLDSKHALRPSSHDAPWQIVLYSDEIVPGNNLSFENLRKNWAVYFSFLEFGPEILCREEAWLTLTTKRSSEIVKADGGIAQLFTSILKHFFGRDTHALQRSGVLLEHGDHRFRLIAHLGMILQDGGAHKLVWCCKGDAGTRMCLLCRNLVARESGIVDEDGSNLLLSSIVHEADLDFASNDDIRGTVQRLAAFSVTDTPGDFKLRQQACGFNHVRHNLLLEPSLADVVRPVSHYCHDWCHAIFVHGVFNTVMFFIDTSTFAKW